MIIQTILSSPIFVNAILPFVLVFTVVFAVLQKTQVLGKEKRQIDALVALAVGLITIAFGNATNMIVNLIPFLAVSLIIILVFLVLWGFAFHGTEFKVPSGVRLTFGIVIAIALIIAVLVVTGQWDWVLSQVNLGGSSGETLSSVLLIVVVIVVVGVVIGLSGGKSEKKEEH